VEFLRSEYEGWRERYWQVFGKGEKERVWKGRVLKKGRFEMTLYCPPIEYYPDLVLDGVEKERKLEGYGLCGRRASWAQFYIQPVLLQMVKLHEGYVKKIKERCLYLEREKQKGNKVESDEWVDPLSADEIADEEDDGETVADGEEEEKEEEKPQPVVVNKRRRLIVDD
jgi:hypothetical protein